MVLSSESTRQQNVRTSAQDVAKKYSPHVAVVTLTIVTLFTFLSCYSQRSFWTDELIMLISTRLSVVESLVQRQDYAAPAYQLLSRAPIWIAGESEFVLRLPALIFAVACVPVVWWISSLLFDLRIAFLAAPLMAINPLFFRYAQEARPYSLFVLMTLLSLGFLVRWLRFHHQKDGWLWLLTTSILVNSHYYGFLYVAAQFAIWLFGRDRAVTRLTLGSPRFTILLSVILSFYLLAVSRFTWILISGASATHGGWLQNPTYKRVISCDYLGELFGIDDWGILFAPPLFLSFVFTFRSPHTFIESLRQQNSGKASDYKAGIAICFLLIVFGIIVPAIIISIVWRPVYIYRYGLPAMIPILLLVLAANDLFVPKRLKLFLPGTLLFMMLPKTLEEASPRPGFPDAVKWIQQNTDTTIPVYVTDWGYVKESSSPEVLGLEFYGLTDRNIRHLRLKHPHGKGFADLTQLPRQERFVILTFLDMAGIQHDLEKLNMTYEMSDFVIVRLYDVGPDSTESR